MNKKMFGNLLLFITAMIWGGAFAAQRAGMDHIQPASFNAIRMLMAACAVAPIILIQDKTTFKRDPARSSKVRTEEEVQRRRYTWLGGLGCGLFLGFASFFQQIGLVYTSAGKAGFITAMYILLVPVFQVFLYKKNHPWLVWTAILIGVAGMYLLCVSDSFSLTYGDSLVIICAVLFSGHILCCDYFAPLGDPLRIAVIQSTTAAIISAVIAAITETPSWTDVRSALIPLLYCGILSGGVGYTLQIIGQKYTDPTVASLLMSLEAVFAVLSGTIFLKEHMTGRELAGCLVMFAAIILVQIPSFKSSQEPVSS